VDRKLARRNVMTGLALAAVACIIFGLTFLAASAYLS
jgi:hypothetical protein